MQISELFLGLLAIGWPSFYHPDCLGTIRDVRATKDTVTVTASARKADRREPRHWSLTVGRGADRGGCGRTAPGDSPHADVPLKAGVPRDRSLHRSCRAEALEQLPRRQRRITFRVTQRLDVKSTQIGVLERVGRGSGSCSSEGRSHANSSSTSRRSSGGQAGCPRRRDGGSAQGVRRACARPRRQLGKMTNSSLGVTR